MFCAIRLLKVGVLLRFSYIAYSVMSRASVFFSYNSMFALQWPSSFSSRTKQPVSFRKAGLRGRRRRWSRLMMLRV